MIEPAPEPIAPLQSMDIPEINISMPSTEASPAPDPAIPEPITPTTTPTPEPEVAPAATTSQPGDAAEIKKAASAYFSHVMSGQIPLSDSVIKECSGFEPRFLLKIFLVGIMEEAKGGELTPQRAEICAKITGFCRECYNSVTVYNISPAAVIEKLSRDLAGLRRAM